MSSFWYALITAGIWGLVPILEKAGLGSVHPSVGLFYRGTGIVIGTAVLWAYLSAVKVPIIADLKSILFISIGGFLASFVGQFLFYRALKNGEASQVVPLAASYPLVTLVIGVLCMGEQVTLSKIAGIIFVVAGIILLK